MAARPGMTRREILTGAAGAAAAASIAGCFPSVGGTWPDAGPDAPAEEAGASSTCVCNPPDGGGSLAEEQPLPVDGASMVATIQRADSIDATGKITQQSQIDEIQTMVDTVLSTLAGGADNPWPVLLPNAGCYTRIGLKINCLNSYLPTTPAVVRAIIHSLVTKLSVCPANIVVWDRNFTEMLKADKTLKYSSDDLQGARILGTTGTYGSSVGPGYTDPNYGTLQGFDESTQTWQNYSPRLSRILTEQTDITINCPVLKSHGVSGVTAGLKNIYGIIDIPEKYHKNLPTALPALYNIPPIRSSIKLTIVDALQAVTLGDTQDRPDNLPKRIFASLDPLALDRYALDLLNQLRAQRNKSAIGGDTVSWLDNAYALGIGTKDYNLVEL